MEHMNTSVFIMLFTLLFNEPISVDPTEKTRDVTRAKTCYHTRDDGIREKHEPPSPWFYYSNRVFYSAW